MNNYVSCGNCTNTYINYYLCKYVITTVRGCLCRLFCFKLHNITGSCKERLFSIHMNHLCKFLKEGVHPKMEIANWMHTVRS